MKKITNGLKLLLFLGILISSIGCNNDEQQYYDYKSAENKALQKSKLWYNSNEIQKWLVSEKIIINSEIFWDNAHISILMEI